MVVQYRKCDACGKEFPIDTALTSAEMLGAGAEICDECKAALVRFLSERGNAPVARTEEGAKSSQEAVPNGKEATLEDWQQHYYNFSISDVIGMDNALIGAANSMSKEELQGLSDDDKQAIGEALYYGYKGRTIAEYVRQSSRTISYNGHFYAKTPDLLAIKVFECEYLGDPGTPFSTSPRPCVTKRISKTSGQFRDAIVRYIKMRLESDVETKDLCKSPRALSNSKKAIVAEHAMQITNNVVRQNKNKASGSSKHYHSKYCVEAHGVAIYASTPDECKVKFFDQWVLGILEEGTANGEVKAEPKAEPNAKKEPKAEPKPRALQYDTSKASLLPSTLPLSAGFLSKWEAALQAGNAASLLSWPEADRQFAGTALIACQEEQPNTFKPRGPYHGTMPRYRMRYGEKWITLPENGRWAEYVFCVVSGLTDEAAKVESEAALAPDYETLWKHASSRLRDCLLQFKKGSTAALLSKPSAEKIAIAKELRTIFGRKIQTYHKPGSEYTQYAISWGRRTICLRGAKSEEGADIAFYHLVFGLPAPKQEDTPEKKPERKRAIVRRPEGCHSLVQVFDNKIEPSALDRVNKCLDAIHKATHLDKKYVLSTIYADMERVYGVNLNTICAKLKQETSSSARVSPFIAIMCDETLSKIFENKVIEKMVELGVESPKDIKEYVQGVIDKHLSEDVS